MIRKIFQHKIVTQKYPNTEIDSSLFIGKIEVNDNNCSDCKQCVNNCPTNAVVINNKKVGINYDECISCLMCTEVCPNNKFKATNNFEFAENTREALRSSPILIDENALIPKYELLTTDLKNAVKKYFKGSLQIREVDAGSCNACDYEINGLNNPFNDVERLGIHFVASPRHADMLLVTGTCTRNMELALVKTYNATPDPKLVVAVGACACSGGIFKNSYSTRNGIDQIVPVDVYIPGCPPRPLSILYGILKAIKKIK